MKNVFFISDHHFHHANILGFRDASGNTFRNFVDVLEMDFHMVDRWNSVVGPGDKVYHLGDFAFGKNPSIAGQLRGEKVLIKGNHDRFSPLEYMKYFKDIRSTDIRGDLGIIMSHVPIHPNSLRYNYPNVHGHLHCNKINDPRYFNVSVEQLNYVPIELGELKERLRNQSLN